MIIEEINFNWHQIISDKIGYRMSTRKVGVNGVTEIREHSAIGEGDRWFYDVHFESGAMERIFNPNHVFYSQVR